jgi:hypothetical protein
MPYKVLKDGATVQKQITTRTSRRTGKDVPVVKSFVYSEGDIISDEDIAPSLIEKLESEGSELLEKVEEETPSEDKPKTSTKKKSTTKKASKAKK